MRQLRRRAQIIFQDPYSSLNPRRTVGSIIGEGLAIHRTGTLAQRRERVRKIMEVVGLQPDSLTDILTNSAAVSASASASRGRSRWIRTLMVCDEPVSALDVSVQAQSYEFVEGS